LNAQSCFVQSVFNAIHSNLVAVGWVFAFGKQQKDTLFYFELAETAITEWH
jgi:hypothetical protein